LRSKLHIHFDDLPPSLQTIFFDAWLTCDRDSGCTNNLANLERITFLLPVENALTALYFKRMLPFNSKKTLQDLRISGVEIVAHSMPDFALLHQFENLTTFEMSNRVSPVQLYESLIQSPFRLKSFRANAPRINPTSITTTVRLLQAPVLHNLQQLGISFPGRAEIKIDDQDIYEQFIEAIVNLPDLETLRLQYYLLHPDWVQLFRKSPRLRSVDWAYFRFRPITAGLPDDGDLERTLADILSLPQDEVLNVLINCRDYDNRSRIHSGDESDSDEDDDEGDDDDEDDDDEEDDDVGYGPCGCFYEDHEEYYIEEELNNYENGFF
jgi:hypothetical protein